MEKEPNIFEKTENPEELLDYVKDLEDPEKVREVIGEENLEKLSEYLKRQKLQEKYGDKADKKFIAEEMRKNREEDREDTNRNYR